MSWFMMFLSLVGKHYLMSSLLDLGYSAARSPNNPSPYRDLFKYLFAELSITAFLCRDFPLSMKAIAIGGELAILAISCVIERLASYRAAVKFHVYVEFVLLIFYICLAAALSAVPPFKMV